MVSSQRRFIHFAFTPFVRLQILRLRAFRGFGVRLLLSPISPGACRISLFTEVEPAVTRKLDY